MKRRQLIALLLLVLTLFPSASLASVPQTQGSGPLPDASSVSDANLVSVSAGNNTLVVGIVNQVQLVVTAFAALDDIVVAVVAQPPLAIFGGNGVFNILAISGFKSVILTIEIYVPSSASTSSLGSLGVTVTFVAPDGTTPTAQNTVSFFLYNDPRLFQLQVGQVNDTVVAGEVSTVAFLTQNTGEETIFLPSFSLTLPQSFVALGASPRLAGETSLSPGQSLEYDAKVAASPTATPGIYPGQLTVTYVDKFGIQHSQNYGVGLKVTSVTEQFQIRVTQVNYTIVSGQSSTVRFVIQDSGNTTLYNPSFSLEVPTPLILMGSTGGIITTSLRPGQSSDYSAVVSSSPGASFGVYQGTLSLTFDDQFGIQHVQTFPAGFVLTTRSQIQFEVLESSLTPGVANDVTILVANTGHSPVSGLYTSVVSSSSTSVLGQLPEIVALAPVSSSPLRLLLFVPLSSAGSPAELTLNAVYIDASGHPETVSQTIGLFVNNTSFTSPVALSLEPTTLQTGVMNNITLAVTNNGGSTVVGLQVTMAFAGQFEWVGQNLVQVPSLAPGQSQALKGVVYVPPTAPNSDVLQASMSYYYTGQQRMETRDIGFLSRGVINLQLTSAVLLPQPAPPGQVVSMTLTLTDLGTIAAAAVTATPELPSGFKSFGPGSYFVGDMQADTPTTFTLSLLVENGTSPGNYQVSVHLTYLDNLRTIVTSTETVSLQVGNAAPGSALSGTGASGGTSRPGNGSLLFPLGYAAIAFLLVGGAFVLIRRRRGHRQATQ